MGGDGASIAKASQVLGGVEAEGAGVSPRAGPFPPVPCSMGLSAIFHHKKVMLFCEGQDRVQIRRLTVKVHRDNGLCSGGELLLQKIRVHGVGKGMDVHENRLGAGHFDGGDRCDSRVGHSNHFVSGPDA